MSWIVEFHKDAEDFFKKRSLSREEVINIIFKALQKFKGKDININIAKLKGEWQGFYRIKIGKTRIIAHFDFDNLRVFIRAVEFREGIYKK